MCCHFLNPIYLTLSILSIALHCICWGFSGHFEGFVLELWSKKNNMNKSIQTNQKHNIFKDITAKHHQTRPKTRHKITSGWCFPHQINSKTTKTTTPNHITILTWMNNFLILAVSVAAESTTSPASMSFVTRSQVLRFSLWREKGKKIVEMLKIGCNLEKQDKICICCDANWILRDIQTWSVTINDT